MTKNNPPFLLTEVFPEWATGEGIFSEMENIPWAEDVDAELLDLDYFGNHSGWKKCSPLVYKLLEDGELSDESRSKLAGLAVAKFLPNWTALWETYHSQYSIMQDYSLTETGNSAESENKSKTVGHEGSDSKTESSNFTHGHVVSEADSNSAEENIGRYGFNSSEASPTDTSSNEYSGQKISTHSGTDSTQTAASNEDSYTDSHSEANQRADNYTKTISGLRGNFTRQQLLMQERELWIEDYFSHVYKDLDTILASMIYNREHRMRNPYMWGYGYYSI